jgi:hypothetical protein
MARIVFEKSLILRGTRGEKPTECRVVSARWDSGDPSQAVAHGFPTHAAAARALMTYRYAAHQQ